MKTIICRGKGWLRSSPGFTLAELMIAMAVGGFVIAGVLTVMTQLFDVTSANSNYMAVFNQVQSSGDWISQDTLMTQQVYTPTLTALDGDIDAADTAVQVNSTNGFPSSGVICIEDELIQYAAKTATQFTGCTRGSSAAAHDDDKSVTVFVALGWVGWSGDQHQVVYHLQENSRQLMRSHLIKAVGTADFILQDTNLIAKAIVVGETTSDWDYDEKELTVVIKAQIWVETATRTYKVHPRPLF